MLPDDVPSLVAPASIRALAAANVLIPDEALILTFGAMLFFIMITSSTVATPADTPVHVLTKQAPASLESLEATAFSSSLKRPVSIMTLTHFPLAAFTIAAISFLT